MCMQYVSFTVGGQLCVHVPMFVDNHPVEQKEFQLFENLKCSRQY